MNSGGGNCLGVTLNVSTGNSLSQIVWNNDGSAVKTVTATSVTNIVTVAGGNGQGSAANQFLGNSGICMDAGGNLYVSDGAAHRVQKWAPGATTGVTVAGGNGPGSAANQLNGPWGIYVDAVGNIYIADEYNYRVQKWAPGATAGVTVAGGNGSGPGANQIGTPISVFVDAAGYLYVADGINERVQKWAPGATSWTTVAGGNGEGSGAGQLDAPISIYVDAAKNIYISDFSNHRIQKWTPGSTSGITVAGGNGPGSGANQFDYPIAVYVDGSGNIYVGDLNNFRIQEWAPGATSGVTVAGGNGVGTAANQFTDIQSIWVDGSGYIYISDELDNYRVQKWAPLSAISTLYTPLTPGTYTAVVTNNAGCTVTTNAIVVNPILIPSVNISSSAAAACKGAPLTFTADPINGGPNPLFQWQVNGSNAGINSSTFTNTDLSDGDIVTCLMTSNAACASPSTASSSSIPVTIKSDVAPSVNIVSSADTICSGSSVSFTATVSNGGALPSYEWQVNGVPGGANNPIFSSNNLSNGDIITCVVTNDGAFCAPSTSKNITITVNPTPSIPPGQVFDLLEGQDIILNPVIKGEIAGYLWAPGTGLSDSTIANPLANPTNTQIYKLTVTTTDGCEARGDIMVKVFTHLRIPNAFTPNADGKNDIFYILGGPPGSLVEDLSIFNRWGQKIFQVHKVSPNDPSFGWNGKVNGTPAPTGTYVYFVTIKLTNGVQQVFKGTIELVR